MSSLSRANEVLQVKRLSDSATLPVRGSEWAAGFDLSSAHDVVIPARGKALVKTDLSIAIPRNTYARIAPRSGLALKKHIDVGAGVVDYDYRGPVGVVLFNHACEDFEVRKGDRIAQMILERICMADVVEVDTLPETTRGAGGFGSTGVNLASKIPSPNGKRLRHDMDLEDADAEVSVGGRLLVFLNELSKTYPKESALCKALKPLALAEDKRLVAAMEAFRATANQDDMLHTLKVICPNGADTTIDTTSAGRRNIRSVLDARDAGCEE